MKFDLVRSPTPAIGTSRRNTKYEHYGNFGLVDTATRQERKKALLEGALDGE
jgi:hypothetical protein